MQSLSPIELLVLDATVRGPEDLERIHERLRGRTPNVPLDRVADAVWSLAEKDLLAPRPSGDAPLPEDARRVWKARFEPTPRGRELLAEEGPLPPPPGWPEGRVYSGMFRGLIGNISEEEIDEARREMWGNFPRDFPG